MANVQPNPPAIMQSTPVELEPLDVNRETEPLAVSPSSRAPKSSRQLDDMADTAAARAFGAPVEEQAPSGDTWSGGGGYSYRMAPEGHIVVMKEGRRPVNVRAGTDMFRAILQERAKLGAAPEPGGPQQLADGRFVPTRQDMTGKELPVDAATPYTPPDPDMRRAGDESWPTLAEAQAERSSQPSGLASTLASALGL